MDYLNEYAPGLKEQTAGELDMQVETKMGYFDEDSDSFTTLYILFVVAPKLGNYRRRILTVYEVKNKLEKGKFPVDVQVHFGKEEKIRDIGEEEFSRVVGDVLSSGVVRDYLEELFRESLRG